MSTLTPSDKNCNESTHQFGKAKKEKKDGGKEGEKNEGSQIGNVEVKIVYILYDMIIYIENLKESI